MDHDLVLAHKSIKKLMPYLHLPIQSGSDKILSSMNRKHTAKQYIQIIDKIRKINPDIALSGDFIVGFPGESDKDFNDTLFEAVCEEMGVEMLWGIGGEDKANSSSDLVERVKVRTKVSNR